MISCSWSLSLARGFPQSELQVAAIKYWWYFSPCNCKTPLLAKFEFVAVITKVPKDNLAI